MVASEEILTPDIAQENPELWDLFTGKDEYDPEVVDQFGRVLPNTCGKKGFFEPLVSQYLIERGCEFEYPDGQPFAVCLTHDIDHIYQPILGKGLTAAAAIRDGRFRSALQTIRQIHNKRHPWCNLRTITEIEERYGARSSFFILALDPSDQDYTYDALDLESDLGEIADEGWGVGLHGGYLASTSPRRLIKDKERLEKILGKPVLGYRAHNLRFKVPKPGNCSQRRDSGMTPPTDIGRAGFRNGMCHPFQPFNLNTSRLSTLRSCPRDHGRHASRIATTLALLMNLHPD